MASELLKRYNRLPIDRGLARVGEHIEAGDVRLGDFMRNFDRLMQRHVIARPLCRETLHRGDGATFVSSGGVRCTWEVLAVIDGRFALLRVRAGREREYTVSLDLEERALAEPAPDVSALAELFTAPTPDDVWQQNRHLLDLWDWSCGAPLPQSVVVRANDEISATWTVETPAGSFMWLAVRGLNIVDPIGRMRVADSTLAPLFLQNAKRGAA